MDMTPPKLYSNFELFHFCFQSLCADENCDKSGSHQIQDGVRSVVVSSPSKSTAENGAKGKGTMREAFPSLPFGSPALDRDIRDKDRAVERDSQQLATTNPSNFSTSPATHTHREEFPRIIERESSSSVINTDGKLHFYWLAWIVISVWQKSLSNSKT